MKKFLSLIIITAILIKQAKNQISEIDKFFEPSNVMILMLKKYIEDIKQNNADFYDKEKEFFELVTQEVQSLTDPELIQNRLATLKTILFLFQEQIKKTMSQFDRENLEKISSFIEEFINNNKGYFPKNPKQGEEKEKEGNKDLPQDNSSDITPMLPEIETIDTGSIDKQMVIVLLLVIVILLLSAVYIFAKKRIKSLHIENSKIAKNYTEIALTGEGESNKLMDSKKIATEVVIQQNYSTGSESTNDSL